MTDVRLGDEHALRTGHAAGIADVEKSFDRLVDAPDRLSVSMLIDRSGDGQVLAERRQVGQCRNQGMESAEDALSPSTPAQECSKTRLACSDIGASSA